MKEILFSVHWALIAALWYFVNGVLHDIFVLINHKGAYTKDLMRLLLDGHILILSGILTFAAYIMLLNKIQLGAYVSIIVAVGMIIYCLLIFPFLKSFGTIAISVWLIAVAVKLMMELPNIFEIMKKYK